MRVAEGVAERLENSEGEYPWQTVRWGFGTLYLAGIPAAHFLLRGELGMALAGFLLGFAFLVLFALMTWVWPV